MLINVAMVFIGTSGILGRFVPVPAPVAIWWRAAIGCLALVAYCRYKGLNFRLQDRKQYRVVILSGILMTAHWLSYFQALKLSSVAIGMLAIFTYPAITTLLEPVILRKPFVPRHLVLAALVVAGVYLLAPGFSLENEVSVGLGFGLLSALIYALRNILVKTEIARMEGSVVMSYQTAIAVVLVAPVWFLYDAAPSAEALPYLIGLGLLTTAVGHTLFLACLRHFSVSSVSLMSCVQPVYGILLGVIFFGEVPGWSALAGGALILSAVVVEAVALARTRVPGNGERR